MNIKKTKMKKSIPRDTARSTKNTGSMKFRPKAILFSPTTNCNLSCQHCNIVGSNAVLSKRLAQKFLIECKRIGIKRVGFTGGEPFLALDFLCALVKRAVEEGMLFDNIMTNAVWYRDKKDLKASLVRLYKAGYDGSICISVDAFHNQNLKKLAHFIKLALSIWKRADIVSVAYTNTARNDPTKKIFRKLSALLKARLVGFGGKNSFIKSAWIFIRIFRIDLSPIGRAILLKNPWDGRWFKEDHCRGPGNVFFVMPEGLVKPCCGYASDSRELTVGNIRQDSASDIMKKIRENRFVCTVFNSGLNKIRKRLEGLGFKFPGKTTNHCYFCHYILTEVPRGILSACLD